MDYEFLLVDIKDNVATITLNRPDLHNAFNDKFIAEFNHILDELGHEDSSHVLKINAKGKSFSSGADLNWMKKMLNYSFAENRADAAELAKLMNKLYHFHRPIVTVAQGPAYGGGIGLLCCSDIVLASSKAHFRFSEISMGISPSIISPYVIKAMGERQARRYFITAETIDCEKALELGIIHEICAPEDLEKRADEMIATILNNGPQAIEHTKELLRQPADHISHELIDYTVELISNLRISDEGQEGLQAFLDKRKPQWEF